MKNTTKSTLILIATLLLGILIGGLGHRAFMRPYFNRLHRLKAHRGVERMLMRRIDPTEEQRPAVEKILRKYGTKLDSIREIHHRQNRSVIKEFMAEISPLLTDDQLERLRHTPPHGKRFREGPPPLPDEERFFDEPPSRGMGGKIRRSRIRHLMAILQPDSTVRDTVHNILRKYVAPPPGKEFREKGDVPEFLPDLRSELAPYIPLERLDSLEHGFKPLRREEPFRKRAPPREHPR